MFPPTPCQASRHVDSVYEKYFQLLTLPYQIGKAIYTKATAGPNSTATKEMTILEGIDGRLKPGTMTLILAPPGHGKSAFLKALTNLLPAGTVKGDIRCTWRGASCV